MYIAEMEERLEHFGTEMLDVVFSLRELVVVPVVIIRD